MKIFLIDVTREEGSRYAEASIMSLELGDGKYRFFKRFRDSSFMDISNQLAMIFFKERPDKVFIDTDGLGVGLSDAIYATVYDLGLEILPDGTIVY